MPLCQTELDTSTSSTGANNPESPTHTSDVEHEPYFEPVVTLPLVQVKTNEEEEEELKKLRCKLFRYHNQDAPGEWKERGTGDVKILHHKNNKTVRLIMRQEKTLKIRANHYITPYIELKRNCNSDRAWVWSVRADFADEEAKHETFAIRFATSEHARQFKEAFDDAKGIVTVNEVKQKENGSINSEDSNKDDTPQDNTTTNNVSECLEKLTVQDSSEPDKSDSQ